MVGPRYSRSILSECSALEGQARFPKCQLPRATRRSRSVPHTRRCGRGCSRGFRGSEGLLFFDDLHCFRGRQGRADLADVLGPLDGNKGLGGGNVRVRSNTHLAGTRVRFENARVVAVSAVDDDQAAVPLAGHLLHPGFHRHGRKGGFFRRRHQTVQGVSRVVLLLFTATLVLLADKAPAPGRGPNRILLDNRVAVQRIVRRPSDADLGEGAHQVPRPRRRVLLAPRRDGPATDMGLPGVQASIQIQLAVDAHDATSRATG